MFQFLCLCFFILSHLQQMSTSAMDMKAGRNSDEEVDWRPVLMNALLNQEESDLENGLRSLVYSGRMYRPLAKSMPGVAVPMSNFKRVSSSSSFVPWAGKRSSTSEGKRFQAWAGKRGDKPFRSWSGKRSDDTEYQV